MSDLNNTRADFRLELLDYQTLNRTGPIAAAIRTPQPEITQTPNLKTMLGHDDTFHTDEVRPWWEPTMSNSMTVTTSYPATHFPIGLTHLDYNPTRNIRIKSYFDNVKFIESNQKFSATIHLDAWWDSIMFAAACTWIPIPQPDRDFQHGKVAIKPDQLVQRIAFGQEYTSTPKVVVWLNGFDVDKSDNWHLRVDTTNVTTRGFTLKGEVWGGTKLYGNGMEVSWIAYPASRPNIDSGQFHTSELREWHNLRHEHSKTVWFEKKFSRPPRVYFAFNRIDAMNNANLRVKAYVRDVTAQSMNLHLDSWHEANMYSSEGQWIAIQDL